MTHDSTLVDSPLDLTLKYRKDEDNLFTDTIVYRKLVSSLVYLTINQLDISQVVNTTSVHHKAQTSPLGSHQKDHSVFP